MVDGSWVLFMRRRQPDYQGFLERMRALYRDESVAVPEHLAGGRFGCSVVPGRAGVWPACGRAGVAHGTDVEPLLLPLPTNEEQQRILAQAQRSTGVTVQGPPGTGKSHTIANIISHYVAYGKRVLVVAEKEQALRSLTGKIPAGIKDLTVSVLGADAESRRELESAIGQIQTRVTALDKPFADERIRQLTSDLDTANRAIAVTTQKLLATREAEVERLPGLWAAGEAPTRAEAARWVAAQASRLGYIDDLITPSTPSPSHWRGTRGVHRIDRPGGCEPGRCLRQGIAGAGGHPVRRRSGRPVREADAASGIGPFPRRRRVRLGSGRRLRPRGPPGTRGPVPCRNGMDGQNRGHVAWPRTGASR